MGTLRVWGRRKGVPWEGSAGPVDAGGSGVDAGAAREGSVEPVVNLAASQ